jgi:hypothetical protein
MLYTHVRRDAKFDLGVDVNNLRLCDYHEYLLLGDRQNLVPDSSLHETQIYRFS